uniref:Uncharacterized protein n=1 Tax=Rhizophora mucronata TaxID=61149 RepID=A0A2P2NJH4_RHIMU
MQKQEIICQDCQRDAVNIYRSGIQILEISEGIE